MADPYELERFVFAQEASYDTALAELRRARKQGHFMWYVFPQLAGLGHSHMAKWFGISGLPEAQAYLAHPVIGPRLVECARAVAATSAASADELFGPVDTLKLRSSMTLFSLAAAELDDQAAVMVFGIVLDRFFGGVPDATTVSMLANS